MEKLLISDIEVYIVKEAISNYINDVIKIFLSAINDWPEDVSSLDDFELGVHSFISNNTTKRNIENSLENIDLSKYAWQSESMSQLLELFRYFKDGITLKDIIDELKIDFGIT
jgi:hypothetical protein